MSVDSTNISQSFTKDSATAAFNITFAILKSEPESIKARLLNSVNPNTYSTLTYDSDYTVAVNSDGSGGIISIVNTGGTETLFVYRETSDKQGTDYTDYNQFPADTLEHDFDRRTMRSQEANDGISRAIKSDISNSLGTIVLPPPADDFGIKWSGTGGTMVNTTFPPDSAPSIAISAMTIAMTAATAASISQIAAASSSTVAGTYASIAETWATLAASSATVAVSAANTALGANRTIDTLLITTNAVINIASIGNLEVTTHASIAILSAPLFSSTTANITGLTVGTLNITNMDTVTVGSITVTSDATIAGGSATFGTITVLTSMTAAMMDAAAITAGNLLVTTEATMEMAIVTALTATTVHISGGTIEFLGLTTTGHTCGSENIGIPIIPGATYTSVHEMNNLFASSGRATGGGITDNGDLTFTVSAGTGFIKATDSDTAELLSFDWAVNTAVLTAGNITYVGVEYNGGSPQIVTKTSVFDFDLDTEWPLGKITLETVNSTVSSFILANPWWVTDGVTNIIERLRADGHVIRDVDYGGLAISNPSARYLAVSMGKLWSNLSEFDIAAMDTSAATGSFSYIWSASVDGWQADQSALSYSTLQWNDTGENTLQTITNNWYANLWVYAEAGIQKIVVKYPIAQYKKSADAEAESTPATLPRTLSENGILLGRMIIRQGVDTPIQIQSAFEQTFGASQAADHGNLAGLGDDDHTQYVAVAGTRNATIPTLLITTSATVDILDGRLATIGTLTVPTSATIEKATIAKIYGGIETVGSITVTTSATITTLSAGTITGALTGDVVGNASTSTVAANLYGTPDLPDGVTATTQGAADNSTKLATTAYADAAAASDPTLTVGSLTVTTDATIANLTATLLTAGTLTIGGALVQPDISKGVTLESPTTADSITLFKVPSACTINTMYAVVTGTSPSATWVVKHGTDRSGGGASVLTAGTITTDLTTGSTVTVFSDATIAAGSWVWVVFPAVTGTVDTLNVTLNYKVDA